MSTNREIIDIVLTEEEERIFAELDAVFSAREPIREHSVSSYWAGSISQSVRNAFASGNYVEVKA